MKIHFSGIGGIGISALAQLCLTKGFEIQGSDQSDTSVIWPILKAKKVTLFTKQLAKNIDESIDLLVYSEAVPTSNQERRRAKELNISQKSYFEFLGEMSEEYKTIAVAGTHGKTSTTAMIARGLQEIDFDANVIVGTALSFANNSNFIPGTKKVLVVEACEYRENFKFLSPEIVVLTSVEWDHIDAFPTEKSYFEAFKNFITNAQVVIAHPDDEGSKKVLENFAGEIIWIDNTQPVDLQTIGEFNVRNARQAVAVAKKLNLNEKEFATGLQKYKSASRRQEFLGTHKGVKVFDDYAHHPSEISVLLEGFKNHFPNNKIGIIFEPHQFSRTREFFAEFLVALNLADKASFYPIYEARDSQKDKEFSLEKNVLKTGIGIIETHADIKNSFKILTQMTLFCFVVPAIYHWWHISF